MSPDPFRRRLGRDVQFRHEPDDRDWRGGLSGAIGVLQDAGLARIGGEAAVQAGDIVGTGMAAYHLAAFAKGYFGVCGNL